MFDSCQMVVLEIENNLSISKINLLKKTEHWIYVINISEIPAQNDVRVPSNILWYFCSRSFFRD